MKFFIPIGFMRGNCWRLGNVSVYGPYKDDEAAENEIARLWPNNVTHQFLIFDGQVVHVKPPPKEKPESEKRKPNMGTT